MLTTNLRTVGFCHVVVTIAIALVAMQPAHAGDDPPQGSRNEDFHARCAGPGVVRCYGFDSLPQKGGNTVQPSIDAAFDSAYRAVLDREVAASGTGSLRFDIGSSAAANTSGDFRMEFSDDLSRQFGNGRGDEKEFYIQWRQRFDANFINLNASSSGGEGEKQLIVGLGSQPGPDGVAHVAYSCTDMHLVVVNAYYRGFPIVYHNCGTKDDAGYEGLVPQLSDDFLLQDALGCRRRDVAAGSLKNCFRYYPNEWMTFQLHVKAGRDYSPLSESEGSSPANPNSRNYHHDSTVELWMARENQPSVLVISLTDYDLVQHVVDDFKWWQANRRQPGYGKIWLLPYDTGRSPKVAYSPAATWYDELIISTRRIPDPGVATPNPPDDLVVDGIEESRVRLKWRINSTNETSFKVERCPGYVYEDCYRDPRRFVQIGSVASGVGFYLDKGASPGKAYSYRVGASNAAGESAFSNAAMNVPGAVADILAVREASGAVRVSWSQMPPAIQSGNQVERCTGNYKTCGMNDALYKVVAKLAGAANNYTDKSVKVGETYTYRVKSFNSAGSYRSWGETFYGPTSYGGASTISQVTVQ